MSQTSVSINQLTARAGLLYDSHSAKTIRSKLAEGAVTFGRAVVLGTDKDRQVKGTTTDTDIFAGVVVHDHARESNPNVTNAEIADEGSVAAIELGPVWVEVFEAVTPGDAVAVSVAAGANNMKFGLTTGANFITVAGAKWLSTTAGAGLAALSLG